MFRHENTRFQIVIELKSKQLFYDVCNILELDCEIMALMGLEPSHWIIVFMAIGICKASQVAELFPTLSPEIFVREARLEDCWEVAETHCSSFFPEYSFPLDFVLRIDRLLAMVMGFSVPNGCQRTCLVAVTGSSDEDTFFIGSEDLKIGGFDGKFSLNKGYVTGILTVDTVADFLPRKGPLRNRR